MQSTDINCQIKSTSEVSLQTDTVVDKPYSFDVDYNIVLGCPRSGTTFLIQSLNALPNSECVSGHLVPIAIPHLINSNVSAEVYQTLSNSFEFSLQDHLESISKNRVDSIYKWFTGCISNQELIDSLQQKRQIERLVYKEPFLAFAPEYTYNSLPNSRIVHIYRDGRDCADSLMRKYQPLTDEKLTNLYTAEMPLGRKWDRRYVPWWVKAGSEEKFLQCTPYVRSVWMWKEMVRRCHQFFSRPEVADSGRVLLLKYEDLVTDPLKYGQQVVEHFGCEMNPRLTKKFNQARDNSIGIHRRRESSETELATEIAEAELKLYGYL